MVLFKKIKYKPLIILFYCLISELFLMGSGQDLHIFGPLTLRMLNYLLALITSGLYLLKGYKISSKIVGIIVLFLYLCLFSICIGLLNGADSSDVFEDIKPLSYFFVLPFLYIMIDSKERIETICKVMVACAKIMVVIYLGYIIILDYILHLDHTVVYAFLQTDSIMFRGIGNAFYYKGFLYLPLAAIGLFMDKKYFWYIIFVVAIYFTYTRGLYVLLAMGTLAAVLRSRNINILKILLLFLVVYLFYQIAEYFELFDFGESFSDSKEESNELRYVAIKQVLQQINIISTFIGHGLGIGVPIRPVHMEISYLEIFHKQGLMGLAFWGFLLLQIIRYGGGVNGPWKRIADFMVVSAFIVYLQSFFNPYINNPIGMGWILLCYVSCYKLAHEKYLRYSSNI